MGTNWQNGVFRTGCTKDPMLRNSRGSGKGSYSVSGTVLDQQGTITNSGHTRCGLQANIHRKLHKRLEFDLNNTLTVSKLFF
jgi:hypothetical protein